MARTNIGRPKKAVVTERFKDGNRTRIRKYTRIKSVVNGQPKYVKIQLRTTDDKVAHRRASVVQDLDDPAQAREYIVYLADAIDEADERTRLARLLTHPMLKRETDDDVLDRLVGIGVDPEYLDNNPQVIEADRHKRINTEWVKQNPKRKHEAVGALMGLPAQQFRDKGASKTTLQDCLDNWEQSRLDRNRKPETINIVKNTFDRFIKFVGNKATNRLTKSDLVKYETHIITNKGDRTNHWVNHQLNPVGRVLRHVLRKTDWAFSAELSRWIDALDRPSVASPRKNRQPMPVATFQTLLQQAEHDAAINVADVAASMPISKGTNKSFAQRNNIKQVNRVKRRGVAWSAILKMLVNCGFDPIDIARLKWSHLHLTDKLPYMDLPRVKAEHAVGEAIPRMTPLHKSTIKALKAWKAYTTKWLGHEPKQDDHVFLNDAKKPLTSGIVSNNFGKVAKAAGVDRTHTCKHIRNVGGSLAKRHKLPDANGLKLAFLGHDENGTNKLYTGDVDQSYLVELVNLIGKEYLSGDQIRQSRSGPQP
ncbi:MAG: hypothetical protein DHS20C16_03680 [Phycisphaerae bacterium]|nr:MAG: hypothetical protein DHS20C16_03680 [Phycisphaerae bacterium]